MSNWNHETQQVTEVMAKDEPADDVAALYSWANLEGVKYRDFSAERQQRWTERRSKANEQNMSSAAPELEAEREATSVGNSNHSAADPAELPLETGAEHASKGRRDEVHELSSSSEVTEDTDVRSANRSWVAFEGARSQRTRSVASVPLPDEALGDDASRWPFLQRSMTPKSEEKPHEKTGSSLCFPPLVFASVAGGTGKTNLVANLGCGLASDRESSLLVETSSSGVLSYYFGCHDSRSGVVRTFESDANHAPVQVFTMGRDEHSGNCVSGHRVYDTLMRFGREPQRVILDISGDPSGILPQVLPLHPAIVVPVVPNTRSVLGLQLIEDLLQGNRNKEFGQPVKPYYLLNRFDSSIPLHRDIRDAMQERFGDRLLPFEIRESKLVDEGLAHGVSVFDYSLESEVAQDMWRLTEWVRKTIRARASASRVPRWSER